MTITAFTDLPTINDKSSFSPRWENLVNVQLPRFVLETNTDIALLNNNSTTGTSTTSIAVGTGSVTLTASTGKSWVINSSVRIYSTATAGIWMDGYVTAYNSGTGSLTVMRTNKSGTGTLASWGIILVPSVIGSDISLNGTGGRITGDFSNATLGNRTLFQTSTTNGATILGLIPNGTGSTSGVNFTNASNTTNCSVGSVYIDTATGMFVNSSRTGTGTFLPLSFATSDVDRMRIDTVGNVLFGSTTNTNGNSSFSSTNQLNLSRIDNLGNGGRIAMTSPSNNAGWLLRTAGSVGASDSSFIITGYGGTANGQGVTLGWNAVAWGTFSDETKKDIIEPISNGLTKVNSLRAVIGKYKTEEVGIRRSFLIAQDVQSVLPEAVSEENGALMLRYTEVIPLLVAAIKELSAEVDALKNK